MDNVKEDVRTYNTDIRDVTDLLRDRTTEESCTNSSLVYLMEEIERKKKESTGETKTIMFCYECFIVNVCAYLVYM